MADTIEDVTVVHTSYTDIYTVTVIVQVSTTQPSADSTAGVILRPKQQKLVEVGGNKVWVIGVGKLSVQEP